MATYRNERINVECALTPEFPNSPPVLRITDATYKPMGSLAKTSYLYGDEIKVPSVINWNAPNSPPSTLVLFHFVIC